MLFGPKQREYLTTVTDQNLRKALTMYRLNVSRSDLSSFVFVFVLVWSGRELGWAVYVCFSMLVFEFGLVWFSIRGSCQLLSLIENHT